jgi:hypothetical protein
MNYNRRKELARVFFDLAKYLLTTVAISGILVDSISWVAVVLAFIGSTGLLLVAFFVMPENLQEDK